MLEYVVIVALVLIAGFWIIRPLLKPDSIDDASDPKSDDELRRLVHQKETAYETIRELEFDLQMGKLSKADYEELKNQYKKEAIDCIKAIEDLELMKNRLPAASESELEIGVENEAAALRNKSRESAHMFCTQCGTEVSRRDRFCFACGSELIRPQEAFISGLKTRPAEVLEQ
jgi:rRNA maturation endonuclease Nob1